MDKASLDESSLSLSLFLVGTKGAANIAGPSCSDSALLLELQRSLTESEKIDMHVEVKNANPGVSSKELGVIKRAVMLKAALEARKRKSQDAKNSFLSSPLKDKDNEEELLVRGSTAQKALLQEFKLSQTKEEGQILYNKVKESNPDAGAVKLAKALRAATVEAALEDREKRNRDTKDSARSPPSSTGSTSKTASSADVRSKDVSLSLLHIGTVKAVTPLSLRAESKSDASLGVKPYSLSLTQEERAPVFAATKLANPDADRKAFNLAYKIALWKADSLRKKASIRAAIWMQ